MSVGILSSLIAPPTKTFMLTSILTIESDASDMKTNDTGTTDSDCQRTGGYSGLTRGTAVKVSDRGRPRDRHGFGHQRHRSNQPRLQPQRRNRMPTRMHLQRRPRRTPSLRTDNLPPRRPVLDSRPDTCADLAHHRRLNKWLGSDLVQERSI